MCRGILMGSRQFRPAYLNRNYIMSSRQKVAKREFDIAERSISFAFSDGENIALCLDHLPSDIQTHLMLHGASAKLGDGFAKTSGPKEAAEQVNTIWANLMDGNWNAGGRSTGGKLAQAIANLSGGSLADVVAKLKDLDDDAIKLLRKDPTIVKELAKMEVERAGKLDAPETDLIGKLFDS